MEVAVAAVIGVGVFVGFCVLWDHIDAVERAVGKVADEVRHQEHARQQRHAETLEALKGRRRA